VGHGDTRVFREVTEMGETLERLADLRGATVPAKVALIHDCNVRWGYEATQTPQNREKHYAQTAIAHYRPFWERGIAVDVVNTTAELGSYDLVIAPLLFMLSAETGARLTAFVAEGGCLVTTYGTGMVDERGLSILGGVPGPLREVLGIWVEEFDALPEPFRRKVLPLDGCRHGLSGCYEAMHYLELLHLEGAEARAVYGEDFYEGYPALTHNRFGKGQAWHVASRNEERFTGDFLAFLAGELQLPRAVETELPPGVTAHIRVKDGRRFLFLLNFNNKAAAFGVGAGCYQDAETFETIGEIVELAAYGSRILTRVQEPDGPL
jgi:beta-galactosidase